MTEKRTFTKEEKLQIQKEVEQEGVKLIYQGTNFTVIGIKR